MSTPIAIGITAVCLTWLAAVWACCRAGARADDMDERLLEGIKAGHDNVAGGEDWTKYDGQDGDLT